MGEADHVRPDQAERDAVVAHRDLQRPACFRKEPPQPEPVSGHGHAGGRDRGGDAGGEPPELRQACGRERSDADPVLGTAARDDVGQQPHRPVVLDVDVEARRTELLEQVDQPGDRVQPADPDVLQPGPGVLADQARPVGDPVEAVVMEGDQLIVRGGPHVGLEELEPQRQRPSEGVAGVLPGLVGRIHPAAAVCHRGEASAEEDGAFTVGHGHCTPSSRSGSRPRRDRGCRLRRAPLGATSVRHGSRLRRKGRRCAGARCAPAVRGPQ